MITKKFLLFFGLFFAFIAESRAQLGVSPYDVFDSSVVPAKRLPQHTEFQAHNYAYPAMPRNQWELGVKLGTSTVSGDVRSLGTGFGAGFHVRKALGYMFSVRGDIGFGTAKGLNFSASNGFRRNSAWAAYKDAAGDPTTAVFYNYKSNILAMSVQGVFSLSNIRFHKANTGVSFYAFAGIGGITYDVKVDALKGSAVYNFNSITSSSYANRKKTRQALKDLLDGNYETKAETNSLSSTFLGKPFSPAFPIGFGAEFKLNNRISVSLEEKLTLTKTDLLDGQQWQEGWAAGPAQTRYNDSYNSISVGINYSVGAKSVPPLWWVNPVDYAYNEINKPRHMQLPKPVLDDKDGDGVTDQFDNEPNTPAGAPVDAHGVSRDSDGDGVPDYKDKELITPTQCQPVDADGVGKCPDPSCCSDLRRIIEEGIASKKCTIGALPSLTFKGKSVALSAEANAMMAIVAQRIRDNANCKVAVVGYCSANKSEQQLSWDRVNAIINYLVDKEGISADRFVFKYGQEGGDCNTVDLMDGTDQEGPTTVPAPHPNLRRKG